MDNSVKIIAFSGFSGSGKTSAVDAFMSWSAVHSNNMQVHCVSFAQPIYKIANLMFNETCNTYKQKDSVVATRNNKRWKKRLHKNYTYRDILNIIGQDMKKSFSNNIWSWIAEDEIYRIADVYNQKKNSSKKTLIIIPDVRFKSELKLLNRLKNHFSVEHWLIMRNDALPDWAKMGLNVNNDIERKIIINDFNPVVSEIEWCMENPKFNKMITNDTTIDEFNSKVVKEFKRSLNIR